MENSTTSKRNPVYDCAKGIGIMLVVMGHCAFFGHQVFTKFHVLFFFIFSGLMLKSDKIIDIKSLWENIVKFWKRYALPYIICNGIFLMFYNLFVRYHLITYDERFPDGISYLTIKAMAVKFAKTFFLIGSSEQLCGATWFLRSLFWGLLVIAIVAFISKKLNINKYLMYGICSLFFAAASVFTNNNLVFMLTQCFICLVLGDILKLYIEKLKLNYLLLIGSILILVFLSYLNIQKELSVVLYGILGFLFILQISYVLNRYSKKIFDTVTYIGNNTLPILFLHLLCFKIVNYGYILLTNSDITMLGAFPIIKNTNHQVILCLCYTLIGIILPILFNLVYLRIKSNLTLKGMKQ